MGADRNWVWYSDKGSRTDGKVSILAVAETIVSVALYWWVAFQVDTIFMLVASPVIAFLVLLRSPQSIKEGMRLLAAYRDKVFETKNTTSIFRLIVVLVIGTLITILVASVLVYIFLLEVSGWSLTWRTGLIIFVSLYIGFAALLAIELGIWDRIPYGNGSSFAIPAVGLGIALRTLLIRCWATTKYLPAGLLNFPQNWFQSTFRQDFVTPPDLIPGLPDDDEFSFAELTNLDLKDFENKLVYLFVLPIFFLPAILYRFTLKSTAWLYLPVIWMAYVPAKLREETEAEVWVKASGRGWFTLISAVGVLGYALHLAFDANAFAAMQSVNKGQMFTPAHLIWAFNPEGWKLWFWITLPSSALTILVWAWLNKIRLNLEAGGQLNWHNVQLRWLIVVNQIKNALIIAWMLMTLLSVARAGWLLGKLPDWMEPVITSVVLPVTSLWSS